MVYYVTLIIYVIQLPSNIFFNHAA